MAELALARAHGHGRVALGELDRVEPFGDRALDVLVGDVLADADEALALAGGAVVGRGGDRGLRDLAGGRADDLDAGGDVRGHEDPAAMVVLDLRARVREQRVRGLAPARHHQEVAADLAAVELDRGEPATPPLGGDLPHAGLAQVDDLGHLGARALQVGKRVQATVVRRDHDGAVAGLQRPAADQPAHGLGEDDADEVVAREEQGLLHGACGHDDVLGAVAVEDEAAVDRDEAALEDSECGALHGLDALERDRVRPVVDQHRVLALGGRLAGGRQARVSAADHEHLGAPVLDVVAVRAAGVLVHLAEAGDVAEELLVERPRAARPDHRPVVEADRRERPADLVRDGEQVVVEGAPDVLGPDAGAFADGRHAGAHVRRAVDLHHAVGARAAAAQEAARAVVLEAAGEDALTLGEEGRGERVALEPAHARAVESEGHLAAAVDALSLLRLEPHLDDGTSMESTSFVRVSRSAVNQASQPLR